MYSPPLCVVSKPMVVRVRQNIKSRIFLYKLVEACYKVSKSHSIESVAMCVKSHKMIHCKYPCEMKKVSWLNNPVWYRNPFSIEGIPADYLTSMVHNRLVESGYDPSKYGKNYFYPSIAFVNRGDNWFENNDELI